MLQDGWDLHRKSGKSHFIKYFLEIIAIQTIPAWDKRQDLYLMGMAGRFLPKLASKIKPSTAMNRNWEKVTMFPQPGNCLQGWKNKHQSHSQENKHWHPTKGGNSSSQSENHTGEALLYSPGIVQGNPSSNISKEEQVRK